MYAVVLHWDYFSTCVYTQQEFSRDQKEFGWGLRQKDLSYPSIHAYFKSVIQDQEKILDGRKDMRVLSQCISRLAGLTKIKLFFKEPDRSQQLWFGNRVFLDWRDSFPIHLEAILACILSARSEGVGIHSLEIESFYATIHPSENAISQLAASALADIRYLVLKDSVSLLSFLATVPLPSLQRLQIVDSWVVGSDLEAFLRNHDDVRSKVWFHNTRLGRECVLACGRSSSVGRVTFL